MHACRQAQGDQASTGSIADWDKETREAHRRP